MGEVRTIRRKPSLARANASAEEGILRDCTPGRCAEQFTPRVGTFGSVKKLFQSRSRRKAHPQDTVRSPRRRGMSARMSSVDMPKVAKFLVG